MKSKLEFHRKALGLSRREMAERLGISEEKYKLIEIGEQTASLGVVEGIEKITGVNRSELFQPQRFTANFAKGVI